MTTSAPRYRIQDADVVKMALNIAAAKGQRLTVRFHNLQEETGVVLAPATPRSEVWGIVTEARTVPFLVLNVASTARASSGAS